MAVDREFIALGGTLDRSGTHYPIGGSAYALRIGDDYLLIDAGLYPQSKPGKKNEPQIIFEEVGGYKLPIIGKLNLATVSDGAGAGLPRYDLLKNAKNIYCVVTHGHLDHSGSAPALKRIYGDRVKFFMTRETYDTAHWGWMDSIKLGHRRGHFSAYDAKDIRRISSADCLQFVSINETLQVGPFSLSFYSSGHLLGGLSVFVKMQQPAPVSVFFTSDIAFHDQRTVLGAPLFSPQTLGEVDYIVTETTYAGRHNSGQLRKDIEFSMIQDIEKTLHSGGKVLLPTLAVGRSAEVISILSHYGVLGRWPIWLDGSAREIFNIHTHSGAFLKEKDILKKVKGNREQERLDIINNRQPCVIIAPAGMLQGGWSTFYARHLLPDRRNLVALTCFQVSNLPGHQLLRISFDRDNFNRFGSRSNKERLFRIRFDNGRPVSVRAKVKHHHFSSHVQSGDLEKMIERMNPRRGVLLTHGEESGMQYIQSKYKNVYPTYVGEKIVI